MFNYRLLHIDKKLSKLKLVFYIELVLVGGDNMRSLNQPLKMISFLFLSIIISVGLIGVSYSFFTGVNEFDTKATMGNIDVIFSDVNVVSGGTADASCTAEARIVNSGKNLEINIENAYAGYTSTINYEVTNNGTVPAVYQLKQSYGEEDNPIQLIVYQSDRYIRGEGGQARGQIIVTVGENIEACDSRSLYTELNFQQAVVEIR